jgi:hypothetical protein
LKRPAAAEKIKETSPSASARFSGPVRFYLPSLSDEMRWFAHTAGRELANPAPLPVFPDGNLRPLPRVVGHIGGMNMLVERGLRVLNVEAVGDAYAIASNYLRKSGAISDSLATNEALLQIIVEMYHRGEYNRIKLANKAIVKFEAVQLV